MSESLYLLNALKAARNNASDYRCAKLIGFTQPAVTKIKQQTMHMAPERVISICKMLGIDEKRSLLRLYRDKSKSDEERAIIDSILAVLSEADL